MKPMMALLVLCALCGALVWGCSSDVPQPKMVSRQKELTIRTDCQIGCIECPWVQQFPEYEVVSVVKEPNLGGWSGCIKGDQFTIKMRLRTKP